jgi:probable F420-dependent oxidoreductase
MEVGIRIPHTGEAASAGFVREWCETASELGFDSLWGADHIVMPHATASEYPLGRRPAKIADGAVSAQLSPNYELLTTLAYVSGVVPGMRLGTAVTLLPLRNAMLVARQVATVDQLCGGKFLFGVGVGWLKEEADAMGMPWTGRGKRTEEDIALMRALWMAEGDLVEFHGEFHDVPLIDPEPRPVQRPVPILIGGHTDIAIDRAARLGDGWIAALMSAGRLEEHVETLRAKCDAYGRDLGGLTVVVGTPPLSRGDDGRIVAGSDDLVDQLEAYERLGIDHVYLTVSSQTPAAMLLEMADIAEQTGQRRRSWSCAGEAGVG